MLAAVLEDVKLSPTGTTETRPSILIADDSPVMLRILESTLQKWGYAVTAVKDGTAAWEILQNDEAPRLAVLDWMMPGLSGPDVCGLVRGKNKSYYTYIILLTSRAEKADLIAGMEAGADDYLVKPFDNNELKVRLGPGRRIIELQEELLAAQEALREQATRDALTKLWNRRAIFEILAREMQRIERECRPMGMLLIDLDKFKSINDTYGHIAGDIVLREAAARIGASIRGYDAAGRYGGEEFIVILPGCDEATSLQTAERIRETIQATPIAIPERDLTVTASFGVTSLHCVSVKPPEAIIRVADEALYEAKQAGRNRCVVRPWVE